MRIFKYSLILILIFNSCKWDRNQFEDPKLIVCTTSIIGDVVTNLVGDDINVKILMGAGVDPHLYEAKPSDVRSMSEAKIIVYNGLHLEGKLAKLFKRMENEKIFICLSDGMNKNNLIPLNAHSYDPHVWFNVNLWAEGVRHCALQLQDLFPAHAKKIKINCEIYINKMSKADSEIKNQMLSIPKHKRLLITSHDAFHYFGKAYNVEVKAIQGVSTIMEPGLKDVSQLVDEICKRNISSIFVESSVSSKSIQSVIEGCHKKNKEVEIGGTLYSDALGDESSGASTYLKMIKKNSKTIYSALK